jgi:HK97 family phage major capsid protein
MRHPNAIKMEKAAALKAAESLHNSATSRGGEFTAAEQETYDSHIAKVKTLSRELEVVEAANTYEHRSITTQMNLGNLVPPVPAPARIPLRTNGGFLSKLYAQATEDQREEIDGMLDYLRGRGVGALANLTPGSDGGNLIPSFVAAAIERDFAQFTPVLNASRVVSTDTGADFVYPVLSDSESAEQLAASAATGLDATVSGDTPPTALTGPKLGAYKISSKPVLLPRETLTDTGLDILGDIVLALVARVARYENLKYTRGNGTTEAQGFLTGCTHFEEAMALDLDVALDLTMAVSPLYRPNGVYMASDKTIKYLRKLKTGVSGDKRQLWSYADSKGDGNATAGTPVTLHGYPIYVNNDLPDINDSGYIAGHELVFGDFSRFVIRRAEQGIPFVYNWPVPAKDGRGLIAFRRSDSRVLVQGAIATVSVGGS